MDVRNPPENYVTKKLQDVVKESFETRQKLEKNMSRRELVAFDKVLSKFLQPENLLRRLEASIQEDYSLVFQGRQLVEQKDQGKSSREAQLYKEPNDQRRFNKSIKNEDALYKQLAFGAIVEQQYKEIINTHHPITHKDKEIQVSPYTFERWYLKQLQSEVHREPRHIDPADYEPKSFMRAAKAPEPEYLNQRQRKEQFFEDHRLVQENKKEQQDRIKLFYILEQFYEHSRAKPDKMSAAQDHLRDYFSDPANTYFFDKNKIQ